MTNIPVTKKSHAPYYLGVLCLIPFVGAFVGLGLLIYSLSYYKDKWLTLIGVFGIVFTIGFYFSLFHAAKDSGLFDVATSKLAEAQLNDLTKSIEFYKLQHGDYPEDLKQLATADKTVAIYDPSFAFKARTNTTYNYRRIGNIYTVFSSGPDGMANTKDDVYPTLSIDTSKVGFRRLN